MKKNIIEKHEIENRKAFNFLRSYYDVLNEMKNDTEKFQFLMAILQKQFDGIEPNLEGIVKLCYVGQKHSIDKSRKGWEDKVGWVDPTEHPTHRIDPYHRTHPTEDPYQQEQEQEEVKEQEQVKEEVKVNNKNLILEDEKFYNSYMLDIHHIMDTLNISKKEAIEQQREIMTAMSSVFK